MTGANGEQVGRLGSRLVAGDRNGMHSVYRYSLMTRRCADGTYRELTIRKECWCDNTLLGEEVASVGGHGDLGRAIDSVFRQIRRLEAAVDPMHLPDVVRDRWIADSG